MNKLVEQIHWYFDKLKGVRYLGVSHGFDLRAFRVALLIVLRIDEHCQVLPEEERKELDELADLFFKRAKERLGQAEKGAE